MEESALYINWKVNNIIRHKETAHPYLVLHISKHFCTLIDLESNDSLSQTFTLLPRNYHQYTIDHNMEVKKNGNRLNWRYNFVQI